MYICQWCETKFNRKKEFRKVSCGGEGERGEAPNNRGPAGRCVSGHQVHAAFDSAISSLVLPSVCYWLCTNIVSSAAANRRKNRSWDGCKTVPDRYGDCVLLCRCAKAFAVEGRDAVYDNDSKTRQMDERVSFWQYEWIQIRSLFVSLPEHSRTNESRVRQSQRWNNLIAPDTHI